MILCGRLSSVFWEGFRNLWSKRKSKACEALQTGNTNRIEMVFILLQLVWFRMKIAVMGMGVAGSYLVSRLKNDHEVVGFVRMDEVKHD